MARFARLRGGGLYIPVGETVSSPPPDERTLIVDTDGSLKLVDPTGTKSGIGGDAGTIVTLGAPAQDIGPFTGLAGDTDGDYAFQALLIFTAVGKCSINPNGSAAAAASAIGVAIDAAGTITGMGNDPILKVLDTGGGGSILLNGTLTSKSGRLRIGHSEAYLAGGAIWRFSYRLDDTATVITSLTFHGNSAGLFNTGSYVRLFKLGRTA